MSAQDYRDALRACLAGAHSWLSPLPPTPPDVVPALVTQRCAACNALRFVTPDRAWGALVTR